MCLKVQADHVVRIQRNQQKTKYKTVTHDVIQRVTPDSTPKRLNCTDQTGCRLHAQDDYVQGPRKRNRLRGELARDPVFGLGHHSGKTFVILSFLLGSNGCYMVSEGF